MITESEARQRLWALAVRRPDRFLEPGLDLGPQTSATTARTAR